MHCFAEQDLKAERKDHYLSNVTTTMGSEEPPNFDDQERRVVRKFVNRIYIEDVDDRRKDRLADEVYKIYENERGFQSHLYYIDVDGSSDRLIKKSKKRFEQQRSAAIGEVNRELTLEEEGRILEDVLMYFASNAAEKEEYQRSGLSRGGFLSIISILGASTSVLFLFSSAPPSLYLQIPVLGPVLAFITTSFSTITYFIINRPNILIGILGIVVTLRVRYREKPASEESMENLEAIIQDRLDDQDELLDKILDQERVFEEE
jgi:hypothetical protein